MTKEYYNFGVDTKARLHTETSGMTEKRFTHKKWYDNRQLFDGDEPFAIVDVYIQANYICDKLNELAEENKELKQRNNRQAKQLDNIYHLIEQRDWRALSDIMDDFKKAEEQLQSEWQTYEDKND